MSKKWHIEFQVQDGDKLNREILQKKIQGMLTSEVDFSVVGDSLKIIKKSSGGMKAKTAGKDYERKVAAILGEWWDKKPFRRTPNSGGWDKQVNDGQIQAPGDIIGTKDFPFCVECKHRKTPLNLLQNSEEDADDGFDAWWRQTEREALTCGKSPLLVMGCKGTQYIAYVPDIMSESYFQINKEKSYPRLGVYRGVDGKFLCFVMVLSDFLEQFARRRRVTEG